MQLAGGLGDRFGILTIWPEASHRMYERLLATTDAPIAVLKCATSRPMQSCRSCAARTALSSRCGPGGRRCWPASRRSATRSSLAGPRCWCSAAPHGPDRCPVPRFSTTARPRSHPHLLDPVRGTALYVEDASPVRDGPSPRRGRGGGRWRSAPAVRQRSGVLAVYTVVFKWMRPDTGDATRSNAPPLLPGMTPAVVRYMAAPSNAKDVTCQPGSSIT